MDALDHTVLHLAPPDSPLVFVVHSVLAGDTLEQMHTLLDHSVDPVLVLLRDLEIEFRLFPLLVLDLPPLLLLLTLDPPPRQVAYQPHFLPKTTNEQILLPFRHPHINNISTPHFTVYNSLLDIPKI